jgi:hypothetical protein
MLYLKVYLTAFKNILYNYSFYNYMTIPIQLFILSKITQIITIFFSYNVLFLLINKILYKVG